MSDGTKWKMLAALLVLLIAIASQRVLTDSEPQRVPLKYTSGQTVSGVAVRGASRPELLPHGPMVAKVGGTARTPWRP